MAYWAGWAINRHERNDECTNFLCVFFFFLFVSIRGETSILCTFAQKRIFLRMWMEADTSNWPSLFEHSRPETVMCIYGPPLFFFDSEMADMGVDFFFTESGFPGHN
jgi:hypothetical protein